MKKGHCIERTLGWVNCSSNIIDYLDKKCSGKKRCSFLVPNEDLDNIDPCNSIDLKNYLEVEYVCIKERKLPCRISRRLSSSAPSAVLFPNTSCSSQIQAKEGQRIRVKIYGISVPYDVSLDIWEAGRSVKKFEFRNNKVTRYSYESESSRLNISLTNFHTHRFDEERIFVTYDYIGCPHLYFAEKNIQVKILHDSVTAEITCRADGHIYKHTCVGHKWIGPTVNCNPTSPKNNADGASQLSMPHGISMALTVIIALAIAFLLPALVLLLLRRRLAKKKKKSRRIPTEDIYDKYNNVAVLGTRKCCKFENENEDIPPDILGDGQTNLSLIKPYRNASAVYYSQVPNYDRSLYFTNHN
ncbi:DgyrCDS6241 [Dimorphilus gyrociliatus]|nr:DgyrCDS6241 [Dimorphilus gyrociliatus]